GASVTVTVTVTPAPTATPTPSAPRCGVSAINAGGGTFTVSRSGCTGEADGDQEVWVLQTTGNQTIANTSPAGLVSPIFDVSAVSGHSSVFLHRFTNGDSSSVTLTTNGTNGDTACFIAIPGTQNNIDQYSTWNSSGGSTTPTGTTITTTSNSAVAFLALW